MVGLLAVVVGACSPHRAPLTQSPVAAESPIRYSVPDCTVRYQVSTVERMASSYPGVPQDARAADGIDTLFEVEAHPRELSGVRGWELLPVVTTYVRRGRYRPFARPDSLYAAIELATDGRHWVEHEGSAMLFRAGGSQIGLVLLFPYLPESSAKGATTDWQITFPLNRDVIATEAARGRHPGLAGAPTNGSALDTAAEPMLAKVRLEDWTQVRGVPAAAFSMKATYPVNARILDSKWSQDFNLPDTRLTGKMSLEGRYLVLETGRLLRATVDMTGTTDMNWAQPGQPPQTMRQTRSMHMQAHLVGACDGPTEQPVNAQPSREDAAIDGCGALAVAVGEGARAQSLSILSPELRHAHGDEALWTTLATYVRSRGQRALPPPVFVEDSNVKSAADVVIVVDGLTEDRSQSNTVTPVEVKFTMHETAHGWLVRRIRARATLSNEDLLDISQDRLYVSP